MEHAFPHQNLVSVADLKLDHILSLFSTAAALKAERDRYNDLLAGKRLAMVFEKESLRTRFTFDIGMQDLGGSAVFLDHTSARLGSRESVPDMAKNLERWVHAIVARTYKHRAVTELAKHAQIPVINGLSDFLHPCQALTDFFTLWEKWGSVEGRRIAYIGDGNNTCHSLMHVASILGAHITVCTPEGYEPNLKVMNQCLAAAAISGSEVTCCNDPVQAMQGAEAVYTDVWASMGQEDETEERSAIFAEYQVNETLLGHSEDALFMHCLPAHRGQEVSAGVIDSERSIVFDIAENRLHVQKSILVWLLAPHLAPHSTAPADSLQSQLA
ncbi:MAG TPA: ornithine carbamoyltransferase [Planctomycetes bacterium]|nr:ornithine carbamoyltransferase [Planctomycetota bacterium]HIK61390.1 ornithine carbamoyltransferase [Planctomycetota bacterium]